MPPHGVGQAACNGHNYYDYHYGREGPLLREFTRITPPDAARS